MKRRTSQENAIDATFLSTDKESLIIKSLCKGISKTMDNYAIRWSPHKPYQKVIGTFGSIEIILTLPDYSHVIYNKIKE